MINVKHVWMVTFVLLIGACTNNNSPTVVPVVVDPPTPPVATVNFTRFVKDQLLLTADDTDPVLVEDINFEFQDLDDPDAYNDVFEP